MNRLNKELTSQKASIEAFKTALEKTKKEKEEMAKAAKSNKLTNKKIADSQVSTPQSATDYGPFSIFNTLLCGLYFFLYIHSMYRRQPRRLKMNSRLQR